MPPRPPSPLRLPAPPWLGSALKPWRLRGLFLLPERGVLLSLEGNGRRLPLLMPVASGGAAVELVPAARRSDLSTPRPPRALADRVAAQAELEPWRRSLRSLARALLDSSVEPAGAEAQALLALWRAWPERELAPNQAAPPLPARLPSAPSRALMAALALHAAARGEVLEALAAWQALPDPDDSPGFTEHLLDAVAFALLGRRDQARDAIEQVAAKARSAEDWLAVARAHEGLGDREASVAAHQRVVAATGDPWAVLRMARTRGDFDARGGIPRFSGPTERRLEFARRVVDVLQGADRHDDALRVLNETLDSLPGVPPADLVVRCARVHLWRRELGPARQRLGAIASAEPTGLHALVAGALSGREGQPDQALALLDAAQAPAAVRLEALLWQAEAHLGLGRFGAALACIDEHIVRENTLAGYLMKLLLLLARTQQSADSLAAPEVLDGLIDDVLPSMCSTERVQEARTDLGALGTLCRELLDGLAGNRSGAPTRLHREGGTLRLEPVRARPSGRDAAVAALRHLGTEPVERTLERFADVERAYPNSPHPCNYGAELLIWLGRYQQALDRFAAADRRGLSRWAFVGRAAVYELLGRSADAERWARLGDQNFAPLPTATTPVYRGERLRLRGKDAEAKRELEWALRPKPRRIGARINLALVLHTLGDEASRTRELKRLRIDAPAILWEAGARPGKPLDDAILLRALELMVWNRSSFLHTLVGQDGTLRVIPDPSGWVGQARLSLSNLRQEVGQALLAGWSEPGPS